MQSKETNLVVFENTMLARVLDIGEVC